MSNPQRFVMMLPAENPALNLFLVVQNSNTMKRTILITLSAIAFTAGLQSCIIHDDSYYSPEPARGYQYSFTDEFNSDQNGWSFRDAGNHAQVYISGGQLHYDYHPADNGTNTVAISTGMSTGTRSFDIRTRFQSDNAMALVYGVSATDYGYSFFVDDRGYFAVYDEGTASIKPQAIIDWSQSSAVRSGWNDVEIEATPSGSWVGYINGSQVFQIPARTLYGAQAGYMVLANTSGDADFLDVSY